MYCFVYLLVLVVYDHYRLDILTSTTCKTLSQKSLSRKWEKNASDPWSCWTYDLSPSSLHYCLHAIIWLIVVFPSALYLDTLGFQICVWVDLLSPVVMSHYTSLPSFMMLSCLVFYRRSCGLPSVMMCVDRSGLMLCFEQGLEWWRRLSPLEDLVSLAQIC
jgi:hypothetical protein